MISSSGGARGVDWRIGWLELGFATYAAGQGAYAGQDRDRRYLFRVALRP